MKDYQTTALTTPITAYTIRSSTVREIVQNYSAYISKSIQTFWIR